MYRFLLMLLLAPTLQAAAQALTAQDVHHGSLLAFLKAQPQHVIEANGKRFLFVQDGAHLAKLPATLDGIDIIRLDTATAKETLATLLPGKKKFTIIDLRPMFARADTQHVYIFPINYKWHPKKKMLSAPEYDNHFCKVDFLTKLENMEVKHYFLKTHCSTEK